MHFLPFVLVAVGFVAAAPAGEQIEARGFAAYAGDSAGELEARQFRPIQASSTSTSSSVTRGFRPISRTTTSTSSRAAPPGFTPISSSPAGPTGGISDVLVAHNNARASHGANPLQWNATAAAYAKAWAERCLWYHGGNPGQGQNLAAAANSNGRATQSGQQMVDAWMAEEKDYNPANPTYSHFTQVVWKGTTSVGCWQMTCQTLVDERGQKVFPDAYMPAAVTTCNYYPPGNVAGQYGANVQKVNFK